MSDTATRNARAKTHPVTITFAYGQELTGTMDLSVRDLELMWARRELKANAFCNTCGEHITDCPTIGKYLIGWPVQDHSWRHQDGLVTFTR